MRPSGAMENEVSSSSMVRAGLSSCCAGATPEKKRQEVTQRTQRRRARRARRRGRTRQELTRRARRRSAQRTWRRERWRRERRKREKNGSEDPPLQRIAEEANREIDVPRKCGLLRNGREMAVIMVWGVER